VGAKIEIEVNQDQFHQLIALGDQLANYEITEEEYIHELQEVLGPALRTIPSDGDELRLVLKPRTQISVVN
jgi:hypothetical protein